MSEPEVTNPQQTPQERLESELNRYAPELVPGAVAHLTKAWGDLAVLSAPALAEKVHERIHGELGKNFRNPEHVPAKLATGADPGPVRSALARHEGELRPGAVEQLTAAWSVELCYKSPASIAGEITRRLGLLENDHYLAVGRALTPDQHRAISLIYRHFSDTLDWTAARKMVLDRGLNLAGESDQMLVRRVAAGLAATPFAARYGARPINHGDPRINPDPSLSDARPGSRSRTVAPAQQPRNPGGQFSRPAGKKPGFGRF
jgi:hypothetical protein